MKVALKCSNILLERTLRLFLQEHLCSIKDSDFIISDGEAHPQKACFKIGCEGHLKLPFTKEQLFGALEEFLSTISQDANCRARSKEERLDEILARFRKEILELINER